MLVGFGAVGPAAASFSMRKPLKRSASSLPGSSQQHLGHYFRPGSVRQGRPRRDDGRQVGIKRRATMDVGCANCCALRCARFGKCGSPDEFVRSALIKSQLLCQLS
jgi:hypothetical protein